MSAASSATFADNNSGRPDIVPPVSHSGTDEQHSRDHDSLGAATPRQGITRHYTSLKEHADAVHNAMLTPGGGQGSSPRFENRREGFTWELGHGEEPRHPTPCPRSSPTPPTPPTLEELSRTDSKADGPGDGRLGNSKVELLSRSSTKDLSAYSLITPSRTDTNRSSISGIARGMIRHVPDMRMFHSSEKNTHVKDHRGGSPERSNSRDERSTQLDFAIPKIQSLESASDPADLPAPKSSNPPKVTLKDRRQLAQKEAIRLTLPLDMPELPARSRTPTGEASSLIFSRPRSPKTPWIQDRPPEWHIQGPKTAPATIIEDTEPDLPAMDLVDAPSHTPRLEQPVSKLSRETLFGRIPWGKSRRGVRTSDISSERRREPHEFRDREASEQIGQFQQARKELDTRPRSYGLSWGSSNNLSITPRSERSQPLFAFSRFIRSKRSGVQLLAPPPPVKEDRLYGRRKQSVTVPDLAVIDKMPIPPSFVPPGLNRVPTPPMFDASGEVKGKLADFFFDLQGVRTHKPPSSPGGVWDSDALLMSQHTDLKQDSSESEDSPRDPIPDTPSNPSNHPLFPTVTTSTGGSYIPTMPPHYISDMNWAHASTDPMNPKDPATRGAEEVAKLEWLIPEHLPSSPLCPLHAKYRGPSKDLCVYHGKKTNLSETRTRRQSGQRGRIEGGYREHMRESYPAIRRESSALDGSEDADYAGGVPFVGANTKRRRRRLRFRMSIP